ncbi:MAG TPA: phosphoribosylaminoimidazolesuccinocarboxamide synthase [Spirochaetota bacterium]|nr:phosphoribosylaminoimidazolesuccinocarboxamide synthase [Spirochaetota bacterium]
MDYKKIIKQNLANVLEASDLDGLGKKIKGKVRDIYEKDQKLVLITTDRQSAFDRNLAMIPFKGQVLTETSNFWFEQVKDIVPNHVLDLPDPNVVVAQKCKIFPIEFVVRGFLTGVTSTAVWTAYKNGEREFCGNHLPDNMVKNQHFEQPIITPTTKSDEHDEKITPQEIIEKNLMTAAEWEETSQLALSIFKRGQEIAASHNLILVDTKYEFGYDENGNIILCDEIHTPDSSRYWLKETYQKRIARGEEPENIDKEFLRLWFKEHCDPYNDPELPAAPEDLVIELSYRYITLYEMITGRKMKFHTGDIRERIKENLQKKGYL